VSRETTPKPEKTVTSRKESVSRVRIDCILYFLNNQLKNRFYITIFIFQVEEIKTESRRSSLVKTEGKVCVRFYNIKFCRKTYSSTKIYSAPIDTK
jgi:hypothetical protein